MKPLLIVASPYYADIFAMLRNGAERTIQQAGFFNEVVEVPGALEIPAAVAIAIASKKYAGYVALGCVLRGETHHFDVVANESARGLMDLSTQHHAAIGNGILTCETMEQAIVRADPNQGDKGGEAANAALRLIAIKNDMGIA